MYKNPGFNTDYIAVDSPLEPTFNQSREEIEPRHVITEIKHGHVGGTMGSPRKTKAPQELQNVISEMANEIANKKIKEMLPSLIEDTMNKMAKIAAEKKVMDSIPTPFESVEGDSSLLDNDTIKNPTKQDFEDAELIDPEDLEDGEMERLEERFITPEILEPTKKKAGRPSTKK